MSNLATFPQPLPLVEFAPWGRRHAIDTKDNFEFERQIAFCRTHSLVDMRHKR